MGCIVSLSLEVPEQAKQSDRQITERGKINKERRERCEEEEKRRRERDSTEPPRAEALVGIKAENAIFPSLAVLRFSLFVSFSFLYLSRSLSLFLFSCLYGMR